MLQPVQLQDVSARYPREIAELRRFLGQTGIALDAPEAAGQVAARLRQDRSFHRDLMSHVWIMLDGSNLQMSYSDLLGVLAIAAAGVNGAARTNERAAHELLRFLMESRHALADVPQAPAAPASREARRTVAAPLPPVTPVAPAQPVRPAVSVEPAPHAVSATTAHATPVHAPVRPPKPPAGPADHAEANDQAEAAPLPPRRPSRAVKDMPVEAVALVDPARRREQTRRRMVYALSGACVLALLLGGYDLLHHELPEAANPPAKPPSMVRSANAIAEKSSTGSDTRHIAEKPEVPSRLEQHQLARSAAPPAVVTGSASSYTASTALPNQPILAAPSRAAEPEIVRVPAAAATMPVASAPRSTATSSSNAPLPATRALRPGSTAPAAVPAAALSKQLDSPHPPAYANDPDVTASGKPYPRLHRRSPSSLAADNDGALLAEMRAPTVAGAGVSRSASSGVASGTVRATCVGMMAGNLMYSPPPAYPAAAASARVQGQVKIQATVDRDGAVTSARVVSGPPLLRDAALDAVQHWRYKPYLAGGKAAPTGTTAVMDFELQ